MNFKNERFDFLLSNQEKPLWASQVGEHEQSCIGPAGIIPVFINPYL